MSGEEFMGGCVVGFFAGGVLACIFGAATWSESIKQVKDEWQRQCVAHGAADYYKAKDGGVEWRWNDE